MYLIKWMFEVIQPTANRPSLDASQGTCFMVHRPLPSYLVFYMNLFVSLLGEIWLSTSMKRWWGSDTKGTMWKQSSRAAIRRSYSQMKGDYLSSFPFTSSRNAPSILRLRQHRFNSILLEMKLFLIEIRFRYKIILLCCWRLLGFCNKMKFHSIGRYWKFIKFSHSRSCRGVEWK